MENRLMRKIFLALLIGSFCVVQSKLMAEEMIQAANVNFEPANQAAPQPTIAPPEQTAAPVPRPANPPASPQAATEPTVAQPSSEVEKVSREEVVRRQEDQMKAQPLIERGLKLYYEAKYDDAISQLEQALKILPRARATEVDYSRATHGLTESYCRLAEAAFQAGNNPKAKQLAQKALEYDPLNRSAENVIVKVKKEEKRAEEMAKHPPQPAGEKPAAPDKTPEFLAKKDDIKKLFRESKILLNSGQYDEAEKRVRQILLIDRYNDDAYTMLQQINDARLELADSASDKTRSLRLWQVTDSWVPKISSEVKLPALGAAGGTISSSVMRKAQIKKKLDEIIFPEISFREAVISDVINFLSEESRRLDPEKVGVNIVLGAGVGGAPAPAPPPVPVTPPLPSPGGVDSTTGPAPVAPTPPAALGGRPGAITLDLRNVPMNDALRYVATLANLKIRIEDYAVIVLPAEAPEPDMETRSYAVNPGVFGDFVTPVYFTTNAAGTAQAIPSTALTSARQAGGGGGSQGFLAMGTTPIGTLSVPTTEDVRRFFTEAGVQFPTNSALVYNQRNSKIITRNTPENLDRFEEVLAAINVVPAQVEIEAKFLEVSQSDLDELGFKWNVAGKQLGSFAVAGGPPTTPFGLASGPPTSANDITAGLRDSTSIQGNAIDSLLAQNSFGSVTAPQDQIATIRGILTNPQFELIIKALSQKKGADLLSAPKVAAVSGRPAEIRVAQEFIYPTTYTPPTAVAAGGGTTGGGAVGVTPATPSAFTTREVGVLLDVIPTVGADGYTINLTLIPQVSEFLGFINYGNVMALAAGANVVTVPNDIKQPLFTTRSVATSIVIWDGQTVVLGGLIREDLQKLEDKVPFLGDIPMLGRLFRSKTTLRTKRNLLIFVTARLIDPAGNPKHGQAALR
jgi:general secretion pathway protein D